jgi:hypothetical protein
LQAIGAHTVKPRIEAEVAADAGAGIFRAFIALAREAIDAEELRNTPIQSNDNRTRRNRFGEIGTRDLGLSGARQTKGGRHRGSAGKEKLSHQPRDPLSFALCING